MTGRRTGRAARIAAGMASLLALAALIGGLPAALYAVSGSPIPQAMPSWHQVIATLAHRDDGSLFLAAVRAVSWLAWAAFTISALVEAIAQARGRPAPRLPAVAPLQAFAAALIGAAVLGILPIPPAPRAAPPQIPRSSQAVAAAPPRPGQPPHAGIAPPAAPSWALITASAETPQDRPGISTEPDYRAAARTHTVVEDDNLWDIAAHYLGNPERWHEIYALNAGKRQPGGRSLTDPDLIYPGWILVLPARPAGPVRPGAAGHVPVHRPPPHGHATPARPPAPRLTQPGGERPSSGRHAGEHNARHPLHHGGPAHQRSRPVAIHLPSGGLVGITFAAAISAALVAWRLHRRRVATARWPIPAEPFEPPLPETIRTLRRAHLDNVAADAAEARGEPWPDDETAPLAASSHPAEDDGEEGLDEFGAPTGRAAWLPGVPATRSPAGEPHHGPGPADGDHDQQSVPGDPPGTTSMSQPRTPPARPLPADAVTFGMRGGTEIPLDSVARHGLGLTGLGAPGTARALLIGLLAAGNSGPGRGRGACQVVIPRAEALQLIPEHVTVGTKDVVTGPPNLIITETVAGALDHVEAETTRQLRLQETAHASPLSGHAANNADSAPTAHMALIARPGNATARRLEAVLDVGARAGVIGVLLGGWDTGVTCSVSADGVVTTASRADLAGVQTFHLPGRDTASLLTLLRGAHGDVADDRPGTPIPLSAPASAPVAASPARPHPPGTGLEQQAPPDLRPEHGGPAAMARRAADEPGQPGPPQPEPGAGATAGGPGPATGHAAQPVTPLAAPVIPAPHWPARPRLVHVRLLGTPRIEAAGQEVSKGLRRSSRELLAFLALFPDGATGEKVAAALWPHHSPGSARVALQTALRSLRVALRTGTGALGPMFITYGAGRYRIDYNLIDVDLWVFHAALADVGKALGNGDRAAAREALTRAVSQYQGPLAGDAPYEWIESYREEVRRDAVDACTRLAGMHEPAESEQALALLDQALTHDPFNEQLSQRIMAIQARLGRADAIQRTLRLLETRLAELGIPPGKDTYAVAADLQRLRLASHLPVGSADP